VAPAVVAARHIAVVAVAAEVAVAGTAKQAIITTMKIKRLPLQRDSRRRL